MKHSRGFRLNIRKCSLRLRAEDWEVGGLELVSVDKFDSFFAMEHILSGNLWWLSSKESAYRCRRFRLNP